MKLSIKEKNRNKTPFSNSLSQLEGHFSHGRVLSHMTASRIQLQHSQLVKCHSYSLIHLIFPLRSLITQVCQNPLAKEVTASEHQFGCIFSSSKISTQRPPTDCFLTRYCNGTLTGSTIDFFQQGINLFFVCPRSCYNAAGFVYQ